MESQQQATQQVTQVPQTTRFEWPRETSADSNNYFRQATMNPVMREREPPAEFSFREAEMGYFGGNWAHKYKKEIAKMGGVWIESKKEWLVTSEAVEDLRILIASGRVVHGNMNHKSHKEESSDSDDSSDSDSDGKAKKAAKEKAKAKKEAAKKAAKKEKAKKKAKKHAKHDESDDSDDESDDESSSEDEKKSKKSKSKKSGK